MHIEYVRMTWPDYQYLMDDHRKEWRDEVVPIGTSDALIPRKWIDGFDSIEDEFAQYKRESIKWSVEDFIETTKQGGYYEISKEKAQEALEDMIHHHDASYGISWNTLEFYIEKYGTRIPDKDPMEIE
jgi:hypothetical protein